MKKDFLRVFSLSSEEIGGLLQRASELKLTNDLSYSPLLGRTFGLIFEKASTRTRVSFEVGINQFWGKSIYLNPKDIQLSRGESIADTARVLSRYLDGVVLRTFAHSTVEEFAHYAAIPVINGLTDLHHPCQAIADLLTIFEKKGKFSVKLAYVGDGNNVAHSLVEAAARVSMDIILACPEGHEPYYEIIQGARKETGSRIEVVRDPKDAVRDADVVYTDVWVSMGQEATRQERLGLFKDYQVNERLLQFARSDAIVMHCLPAHREEEITSPVMDGPQSVVFDQAENRLHTQKALIEILIHG